MTATIRPVPSPCGTVRNELAKMRRLRIGTVDAVLLLGVLALTAQQSMGAGVLRHLDDPDDYAWKLLLANLHFAVQLTAPLLIAVMASRLVEVEHAGNGWIASATAAGVTPGRLCRAKFVALGLLITPTTVLWGVAILGLGTILGVPATSASGRLLLLTVSLVVVDLAVLAVQLLISARTDNQLLCICVGLGGTLLGIFAPLLPPWLQHLTPWTYYGLVVPADFVGPDLVYLDPRPTGVLGLALVGTVLFLAVTARFDRQEA